MPVDVGAEFAPPANARHTRAHSPCAWFMGGACLIQPLGASDSQCFSGVHESSLNMYPTPRTVWILTPQARSAMDLRKTRHMRLQRVGFELFIVAVHGLLQHLAAHYAVGGMDELLKDNPNDAAETRRPSGEKENYPRPIPETPRPLPTSSQSAATKTPPSHSRKSTP